MRNFYLITALLNAAWLAYALLVDGTWTWWKLVSASSFWIGQEMLALRWLNSAGQPVMDNMGNLDSCIDLADPDQLGILSYVQDLLWVCWLLQALTQFVSGAFWAFYPVVPLFAVYKLWNQFVQPMLNMQRDAAAQQAGAQQQGDENLPQDAKSRMDRRRQELRNRGGGQRH